MLGFIPTPITFGRRADSQAITKAAAGISELSESDCSALISTMSTEAKRIITKTPKEFSKLRADIERVTLEELITEFSSALKEQSSEAFWQNFFNDNQFALQQVFGIPVSFVQQHPSVGGQKLDGSGGKISDFMLKNSITSNIALVEIKKPLTKLLAKGTYRSNIYSISSELNGSIAQILDQAHYLSKHISDIKDESRQWNLETYDVKCIVIAGRSPLPEEYDKCKSFELFRKNSRMVTVVTYDEVLEKLSCLLRFLSSDSQ